VKNPTGTGGTEEIPSDSADWDAFLKWYRALGCPIAKLEDVADHIIHVGEVAGIDHVGIGSDFDGVPALPEGLESAASLPRLTERLLARGLSESDVEKVLGGNFMRAFKKIENGRA
jgi:membrane dipeptidase